MLKDWTAEVVARLHTANLTQAKLAEEIGITVQYLSEVLHKKKGNKKTKEKVLAALEALEQKNH